MISVEYFYGNGCCITSIVTTILLFTYKVWDRCDNNLVVIYTILQLYQLFIHVFSLKKCKPYEKVSIMKLNHELPHIIQQLIVRRYKYSKKIENIKSPNAFNEDNWTRSWHDNLFYSLLRSNNYTINFVSRMH